jgi:hypothetical protein
MNDTTAVAGTEARQVSAIVASQREMAEVQAAMVMAKRFPRDTIRVLDRIVQAFARPELAEKAQYQYARGGNDISGPSIRALEAIAQLWGNVQSGVRELEQRDGESTVEAYAWDLESGFRDSKVFQVAHIRDTKKGSYELTDGRDIYELIANQGARRKRACLQAVIPVDVVEAAMHQADVTLNTKAEVTPERLKEMLEAFTPFGVTREMIEARIQRRLEALTPALLVNLRKICNSLRDGMSAAADWFDVATPKTQEINKGIRSEQEGGARDGPPERLIASNPPPTGARLNAIVAAVAAGDYETVQRLRMQNVMPDSAPAPTATPGEMPAAAQSKKSTPPKSKPPTLPTAGVDDGPAPSEQFVADRIRKAGNPDDIYGALALRHKAMGPEVYKRLSEAARERLAALGYEAV